MRVKGRSKRTTRTEDTRWRSRPERTRREGRKVLRVARRCTDEPRDTESIFVGWLRRWRDKKPAASTPDLARPLSFSLSLCLSLFPFSSAAFPRISLSVPRFHPSQLTIFFSSLSPRRSLSLLFSLPATPLFMPPHSPGRPCLAPASLFIRHAQSPPSLFLPFSTVPPLPLLLPNVTTSVAFSPMLPGLSSSSTCKPIAHASERTRRSESRRERGSEIEREKESEYRIHERAKTRRGRAGAREREVERDQRRDVPAKSDGIRRGRKEEEEGEKRWMLKRGRASGTPANGRNVR